MIQQFRQAWPFHILVDAARLVATFRDTEELRTANTNVTLTSKVATDGSVAVQGPWPRATPIPLLPSSDILAGKVRCWNRWINHAESTQLVRHTCVASKCDLLKVK